MERTFGWRHFRVLQKRGQGKAAYVLMAATCDEQTQFWVRGVARLSAEPPAPVCACRAMR
jgi:tryptophan-rich hypothetical protein